MQTVYKYNLKILTDTLIENLPNGDIVFSEICVSEKRLTLWILVDPEDEMVYPRTFRIAGTGSAIDYPDGHEVSYIPKHLFSQRDGVFVWHIFEIIEEPIHPHEY